MELYLLRHGLAVEHGTPKFADDVARPLTAKGRRQVKKISSAMKEMKLGFDLILSSPFTRARQTAEIVAEKFKLEEQLAFAESLKPGGSGKNLAHQLGKLSHEKILLVGHEPDLSRLVSMLVAGENSLAIDFKKGSLCKLDIVKIRFGRCATLAWLLAPAQMKLMR